MAVVVSSSKVEARCMIRKVSYRGLKRQGSPRGYPSRCIQHSKALHRESIGHKGARNSTLKLPATKHRSGSKVYSSRKKGKPSLRKCRTSSSSKCKMGRSVACLTTPPARVGTGIAVVVVVVVVNLNFKIPKTRVEHAMKGMLHPRYHTSISSHSSG